MTILYNKSSLICILAALSFLILALVLFNQKVFSHPGNTDSSGGHHCWTNCDYWGYEYGEYHYHNGGYSTSYDDPDYYQQGIDNGSDEANERSSDIKSLAATTGEEDGYNAGRNGNLNNPDPDASDTCDMDFTFEGYAPEEYQEGFYESFRDACGESYKDSYIAAYESAHEKGREKKDSAESDTTENTNSGSWGWLLGIGALYGGVCGVSFVSELIRERKS